jgi:hypothetical protein
MAAPNSRTAFKGLLAELRDDGTSFVDEIGSTYALDIPTQWGALHLLFRLDEGDVESPDLVAAYLGGRALTKIDRSLGAEFVRQVLREAPWLANEE